MGKNTVVGVFLFAAGVILALLIAGWIGGIFRISSQNSNRTFTSGMYCNTMTFTIERDSVRYRNNTLSFAVKNTYSEPISTLIVKTDTNQSKGVTVDLYAQEEKAVMIGNITINQSFAVFPDGCEAYNKKTFSLEKT